MKIHIIFCHKMYRVKAFVYFAIPLLEFSYFPEFWKIWYSLILCPCLMAIFRKLALTTWRTNFVMIDLVAIIAVMAWNWIQGAPPERTLGALLQSSYMFCNLNLVLFLNKTFCVKKKTFYLINYLEELFWFFF